jgi:hypothetical protein
MTTASASASAPCPQCGALVLTLDVPAPPTLGAIVEAQRSMGLRPSRHRPRGEEPCHAIPMRPG